MVLTDRDLTQVECIFLLIDNCIIPREKCMEFMASMYHEKYEVFVLLNWMLTRWVVLRQHKFHLPKRITYVFDLGQPPCINLNNLVNSNSTQCF